MKIRHIATRFALLLGIAAVVPLLAYGVVSILSLQRGTRESVINGNQNVAARAAEEIRRYVVTNAELLKALAADLQDTGLSQRQQDQILKNYVLQFREFREITLFDEGGAMIASSRAGKPRVVIPKDPQLTINGVAMSPIRVDEDLLPTSVFAIRLTRLNQPSGWLAGEFSLEEMWRMVDQIRIGDHGYALVVAPGGELVAHGDPDKKALVAQTRNMSGHQLFAAARSGAGTAPVSQRIRRRGRPDAARRRRPDPAARLDRHRRTADPRSVRERHSAPAAAGRRDCRRAAGHDRGRLSVRPQLHRSDSDAAARHPGDRRRPAG